MLIQTVLRRLGVTFTPMAQAKTPYSTSGPRDISALRISYEPDDKLHIDSLPTNNPFDLFGVWFDDAKQCEKIVEPNAMTMASANRQGVPSARMLLLKGFGAEGFRFFSNYESRKGRELAENPNASLLFYWEALHRQVRIEGSVEKLSPTDSDDYFHSRPHGSQLGACVSEQSAPIPSHQVLDAKYAELQKQYPPDKTISRPENWGGYLLTPRAMEFWQGQANRLHRRIQFTKDKPDVPSEMLREASNGWYYYITSS